MRLPPSNSRPSSVAKIGRVLVASDEHADHRHPEAAIGPELHATGSCQLVLPAGIVALTAEEPVPLAAAEHVMEDHLASGLLVQAPDVPRGEARAKRAAMHGVQDREVDVS